MVVGVLPFDHDSMP
jgi:serine/threonine protein kinase